MRDARDDELYRYRAPDEVKARQFVDVMATLSSLGVVAPAVRPSTTTM